MLPKWLTEKKSHSNLIYVSYMTMSLISLGKSVIFLGLNFFTYIMLSFISMAHLILDIAWVYKSLIKLLIWRHSTKIRTLAICYNFRTWLSVSKRNKYIIMGWRMMLSGARNCQKCWSCKSRLFQGSKWKIWRELCLVITNEKGKMKHGHL